MENLTDKEKKELLDSVLSNPNDGMDWLPDDESPEINLSKRARYLLFLANDCDDYNSYVEAIVNGDIVTRVFDNTSNIDGLMESIPPRKTKDDLSSILMDLYILGECIELDLKQDFEMVEEESFCVNTIATMYKILQSVVGVGYSPMPSVFLKALAYMNTDYMIEKITELDTNYIHENNSIKQITKKIEDNLAAVQCS